MEVGGEMVVGVRVGRGCAGRAGHDVRDAGTYLTRCSTLVGNRRLEFNRVEGGGVVGGGGVMGRAEGGG